MSDCKRASLSQIINLFIPAKYVELGDKAVPSNTTIQMVCNQKVIDDVELSHSVANGMEAVQSSFENLPI